MMQTQIPRGLQALMQASQVLSTQALPSAPGPQGPQPTVAERVNQQIKQMSQPQGGIMSLPPGLRDIGQQAGVAGQIMAQRQAQQQKMAQNPEAVAQMAAQMVKGQGVDQLPVSMEFKDGGIIGFSGQERSDVPSILEDARQKLIAATKSGDARAAEFYAKQVAELSKATEAPSTEGASEVSPEFNVASNVASQAPSALGGPRPSGRHVLRGSVGLKPADTTRHVFRGSGGSSRLVPSQGSEELAPIQNEFPTRADRLPSSPPVGIAALPQARPSASATQPAAPAALPASAAPPAPETKIDTSGIKPIDISKGLESLVPARAQGQVNTMRALEEERAKLKAGMADQFEAGIAALEKDKRLRKQLTASKAERDNFNRMIAFFGDLRTKGNQYGSVQEAIFARDEAERLADLAHDKAVIEQRKAQQADRLGNIDRKIALEEKANNLLKAEDTLRVQAAQVTGAADRARFEQEMQTARTASDIAAANMRNAAEIAQRDRAVKANLRIEREKVASLSAERQQSRDGQLMNAALGRYTQAMDLWRKVVDDNKAKTMLSADSKDPGVIAARKDAIDKINAAWVPVTEARRVYDGFANKVFGLAATSRTQADNDPLDIR